jgi:hypothetical protein
MGEGQMKQEKQYLSGAEKTIISGLSHSIYTVDFIQEWINRNDLVSINAFAALQAVAAKGFYEAVKAMNEAGGRITYKRGWEKEAGTTESSQKKPREYDDSDDFANWEKG